jgi:hypothetical protein
MNKSKQEVYQEEYTRQLQEFKDKDLSAEYPEEITKPGHILVRFLKVKPEIKRKSNLDLIVPDGIGGLKDANEIIGAEIVNLAKVVKASADSKYKKGDIVVFPFNSVQGYVENPEAKLYRDSQRASADAKPPEDKRLEVPAIEVYYKRYMYKKMKNYRPDESDRLTYCISDLEPLGRQ